MRYIEKKYSYFTPIAEHKVELILCKLDEYSLSSPNSKYSNLTGAQLYDMVRDMTTFSKLKRFLQNWNYKRSKI